MILPISSHDLLRPWFSTNVAERGKEPEFRTMQMKPEIGYYAKIAERKLGLVSGQVEVVSACFQKCIGCQSWRDHKDGIERGCWNLRQMIELFIQLRTDFAQTFEHLTFTGGDPQAWPYLTEFLQWMAYQPGHKPFELQISTAFMKDPCDLGLWHFCFDQVRVSLDAAYPDKYHEIRGVEVDPVEILKRIERLQHPNVATITTVFPQNIGEMVPIVMKLANLKTPVRKAMFLPCLGDLAGETGKEFWEEWSRNAAQIRKEFPSVQTSFAEDPRSVRLLCNGMLRELPCRVGNMSFHLKADGSYYPCCLIGGEAIQTQRDFCAGQFPAIRLEDLYKGTNMLLQRPYGNPRLPCSKICQYKQLTMNFFADQATRTKLAMP